MSAFFLGVSLSGQVLGKWDYLMLNPSWDACNWCKLRNFILFIFKKLCPSHIDQQVIIIIIVIIIEAQQQTRPTSRRHPKSSAVAEAGSFYSYFEKTVKINWMCIMLSPPSRRLRQQVLYTVHALFSFSNYNLIYYRIRCSSWSAARSRRKTSMESEFCVTSFGRQRSYMI